MGFLLFLLVMLLFGIIEYEVRRLTASKNDSAYRQGQFDVTED